jgi:hypothetical protein
MTLSFLLKSHRVGSRWAACLYFESMRDDGESSFFKVWILWEAADGGTCTFSSIRINTSCVS